MLEGFSESKSKKIEESKFLETKARTTKKDVAEMIESFLMRVRHPVGLEAASIETKNNTGFPDNPDDIVASQYLGGSSGVTAGYFNNELLVVKKARIVVKKDRKLEGDESGADKLNTDQLVDEYIADRIYEAMGISVPTSKIYAGGTHKISKFIPGKDLVAFSEDSPEFEKIKKELQKGFVLDCLLANWDVIGTAGGDNIRLGDDGRVYRIDNGGALRFRARGGRKGDTFGERVGELDSLRVINPLFADISDEDISKQIGEILKSGDKILGVIDSVAEELKLPKKAVAELRNKIEERLAYLKNLMESRKKKPEKTDKGEYESIVTNNYFEGWDEVELQGNDGIKDKIRENIIAAEKNNERYYRLNAEELGISVEEFKMRLQRRVEDVVNKAEFFRATHVDVLEKIMGVDGRWKSQFETRTSNGTLDPRFRAAAEMKMFGFNKPADWSSSRIPRIIDTYYDKGAEEFIEKDEEKRPIYGYFSDEEHGAINNYGTIPPPNHVEWYGTINVKIKKEVALKRATLTFHDSLGPSDEWPPTPASKPHFTSFRIWSCEGIKKLQRASVTNWGERYTEVQFHGQLTMDDVESIHVSSGNGVSATDIKRVRSMYNEYMKSHPESTIKLIEF